MTGAPDPNPYRPPQAEIRPIERERSSAGKAILFGILADLGLTIVLGLAFVVAYGIFLISTGAPEAEVMRAFSEPADDSPFTIGLTAIGTLGSILGGYICAITARHSEYKLGAVIIGISVVLGLLLADETSATLMAVTAVLTVGGVLYGTWLGVRRNRRAA